MFDLEGARVVITGAGGGVGGALCAAFAAAGARIVGCDRSAAEVPGVCTQALGFDLQDGEAVAAAGAAILAGGTPDVVISNAGMSRAETLADVEPATLATEMDINFTGAARLSMTLLDRMRRSTGNRSFVFIASINAQAHFGNPVYSAAKAALVAWMRALATEEGRHGIRANAVLPASIRTNAWNHRIAADPDILQRVIPLYPLGRMVTPEEVANAALFLASPLASGITGTTLNVDAGLSGGNLPFLDAITLPETR